MELCKNRGHSEHLRKKSSLFMGSNHFFIQIFMKPSFSPPWAPPWGPKGPQGPRDQYKKDLKKSMFEIFLMLDHCLVINAILTLEFDAGTWLDR